MIKIKRLCQVGVTPLPAIGVHILIKKAEFQIFVFKARPLALTSFVPILIRCGSMGSLISCAIGQVINSSLPVGRVRDYNLMLSFHLIQPTAKLLGKKMRKAGLCHPLPRPGNNYKVLYPVDLQVLFSNSKVPVKKRSIHVWIDRVKQMKAEHSKFKNR